MLLPTLTVPRDQMDDIRNRHFNRLSYQFICPYKSPQAWLVYRLSSALLHSLLRIPAINNFFCKKSQRFWDHIKSPASDWSSFDLWVVRQFDQDVWLGASFNLKVYKLHAFEWAVAMFRDSPSMIPHLQNVLETISPSVAVSAVLGMWNRTMWEAVSNLDVEPVLRFPDPYPWDSPNSTIPHPVLQQPEGINLLCHHQYWATGIAHPFLPYYLDTLLGSVRHADLQHSVGLRFVIPFSVVDRLWTHEDLTVRAKSLTLLPLFEQSWKPCPGYDAERHDGERRAFMRALTDHINCKDRVSALLTSKRGQAFIRYIHNEAITRRLLHFNIIIDWHRVIEKAQEVGGLPFDYFVPIPGDWNALPTLPDLGPIRYSINTERDNDGVLDIVTSNGTEDSSGAGSLEGGLIQRSHNFGAWLVAHRWLSFFSRATHNDVNDNPILGSRIVDSPDEMVEIASRESGVDGRPTDEDRTQNLGKNDSMKDPGPSEQTDVGILGNSSRQGEEVGDIGGNSYRLRRQGSRVDAMGQPAHDQEDFNEDNALGIHTGTLGDLVEQGNEVGVHGDIYRPHRRQVSDD
uniref:Uncharacterized protein n=1 Tax=Moniliophthora roreri TaxID=221103 RepID=A0A0W0G5T1_MONRR